jgi:large subunit ribosomal protein L21
MDFSIIETGGKQYLVSSGDVLLVEKLVKPQKGSALTFDKVLLTSKGKKVTIGTPYIKDASVPATFVEEGKGKKIITQKFKAKSNRRTKKGHRQPFTKVKIQ